MAGYKKNSPSHGLHELVKYKDDSLPATWNTIVEIRQSYEQLISTMRSPTLVSWYPYIDAQVIYVKLCKRFALCGVLLSFGTTGIILCMRPANERRCYIVTSSLIGWAHTQNDPWNQSISPSFFHATSLLIPFPGKQPWRTWLNTPGKYIMDRYNIQGSFFVYAKSMWDDVTM